MHLLNPDKVADPMGVLVHEILDDILSRVRYKVLTLDMKSTGLAHSKIVKYRMKKWNHPWKGIVIPGKCGAGGLWANANKSMARGLQRYLKDRHDIDTRIHLCIIDQNLFESSYRTKTNRLFLLDPIV